MALPNSGRTLHLPLLRPAHLAWLPALLCVAVICGESTNTMGASHTSIWLSELAASLGHPNGPVALVNHLLRKSGHFAGYGLLGLCFARGWYSWVRRRTVGTWTALRLHAVALGVGSTFVVASADEIHQVFLPTRGASGWDVLLDTSGAVTFTMLVFAVKAIRRSALMAPSAHVTRLEPATPPGPALTGLSRSLSYSSRSLR